MEVERLGKIPRSTCAAVVKEASARAAHHKPSFSAAAVFKKTSRKIKKKTNATAEPKTKASRQAVGSSRVQRYHGGSVRSSSSSPQKGGKKSDMHPLVRGLKGISRSISLSASRAGLTTHSDSTSAYRSHLYKTTAAKLDKAFDALISQLHECNMATLSSPPNPEDPNAPPVKLTLGAKYERKVEKAFRSIGDYSVTNHHINKDGSLISVRRATLREKLTAFEESHVKQVEELKTLEAQWEKIVGEIYKTGAACLGDAAMSSILLEPEASSPLSPSRTSAQGHPPMAPRKRVTFQEPKLHREYPAFLYGPSMYRNHPIAALPAVPEDEVKQLGDAVGRLGVKQIEEFKKLETEQARWWNKKCSQVAQTLQAD
jgi:hypothetical protein